MHAAARDWVARWAPDDEVIAVEIGGRDINGTVTDLFRGQYTTVDLVDGRGVDVVADFLTWTPPRKPDVVVCCEVLEHVEDWQPLVHRAAEILKVRGSLIVTCAGPDREPHSAVDGGPLRPGEWYRNIEPTELRAVLDDLFAEVQVDHTGDDVRAFAREVKR